MYDFEKYYNDMNVKAEANIDLSGVQIENPQGNPNEHVTNNVVYFITGIAVSNDPGFTMFDAVGINDRLRITVEEGSVYTTNCVAIMHPISDLVDTNVASAWNPGKERETFVDLDSSAEGVTITYTILHDGTTLPPVSYAYARVFVSPRYEFITNNGADDVVGRVVTGLLSPTLVNQNVISHHSMPVAKLSASMRAIYMMLGLNGSRKVSIKTFRKGLSARAGRYNAVIGYDLFRKRMNQISDWCAENNYGVDVKYYDQSMSDPLPDNIEDANSADYKKSWAKARAKHHAYVMAVAKSDKTRTSMKKRTSFDEAYNIHLPAFLENPKISPLVDNLTPSGDGVTAIIPPLKDAVKGVFYPKEEIENEFYENFENVYEEIKDALSIMRRYLSKKIRRKMDRLDKKYTRYPSGNSGLAFDLDSLINAFQENYQSNYNAAGEWNGILATGNKPNVPEYISAFPRVFQINGKFEPNANNTEASWVSLAYPSNPTFIGSDWVTATSAYYRAKNYTWDKKVVEMSGQEVREAIVDAYNWILKKDGKATLDYDTDIKVDNNTFDGGYNSGVDTDARVKQCKRLIEFIGGWINLFKKCGSKEGVWAFMNQHPFLHNEDVVSWLNRMVNAGLTTWSLKDTYSIIEWDNSSSTSSGSIDYTNYVPAFTPEWGVDPESDVDIDDAIHASSIMVSAYKEMRSQLVTRAFLMNPVRVARAWLALEDASEAISGLQETIDKIIWYQAFVNESVFTNHSMYLDFDKWLNRGEGDDDDYVKLPFTPWALPARFMVPVSMYRKVRKKYRTWYGRTRHKTVKVFDGVRWAEVRFYDLNVYTEYPQIEETPGNVIQLGQTATIEQLGDIWYLNFDNPLPEDVWNAGGGEVTFDDIASSTLRVEFDSDVTAHVPKDADPPTLTGEHVVVSVKVPPERSRNDSESKTPVTIHLKAPGLPYDEEIRKQAFVEYGPFSQNKFFEVVRYGNGGFSNVPEERRFDGWKVFRPTSRKIEDMREGFGLYDKVAFLMSILVHEFGAGRVELINTWRSMEDQKGICTGGPESSMLSWHNYGMAAKILIYKTDRTTPIEDKSDDMKRLVKVARAFTEICADGRLGTPCNVVWCGRLTINPSLFDWEFLPLGLSHKDAFKFREAILAQRDPVKEFSYVDVDASGMVYGTAPVDNVPYILNTSASYRNAKIINGHHYVSPDRIVNYHTPEDIVLYDLVEYIDLINLKMNANGNNLGTRGNIYEWKALNDSSCSQLIRYFALTNNIKSAKALIAGDFVEKYQAIEDAYYSTSAIEYVKNMLGEHYEDACITIDSMNDAGYISLSNGKMYIKVHDQIPDNVPTMIDMHGQQRVDRNHIKRGIWRNGLFYGIDEIEIPYTESDGPVIEGYVNGTPSYGEAMFLHQAIASELHEEFLNIRNMFERYQGSLMYDRFQDGPNASKFNQLENEFGAIAAQDLMDFDELEAMLAQDEINKRSDIDTNGERNGIGDGSIYEKVVNNAQLAGMRKAVNTSERIHITDKGNGMTPGEIYRAVMEGRAPGANDLMSRR